MVDGRIVYGLGALKNVGVEAMRLIVEARAAGGRFAGLFDFAARVDLRRIGKRALETLARAGALDALDSNRRKVFEALEALIAYSAAAHDERASAQVSLFGELAEALPAPRLPQPEDWSPMERLAQEHQAVGFYLSGHPLDDYAGALRREGVLTHAELVRKAAARPARRWRGSPASVAAVELRRSARGTRFAFVRLSDPTGLFEVRMFADVLDAARDALAPGRLRGADGRGDGGGRGDAAARQGGAADRRGAGRGGERRPAHLLNEPAAAASLAARLVAVSRDVATRRRGPVEIVAMTLDLGRDRSRPCPTPYPLTPQVLGALKSVPGVVHLEEF